MERFVEGEVGEYWSWWHNGGVTSCEERKTVGTGGGRWISDPRKEMQEGTLTVQGNTRYSNKDTRIQDTITGKTSLPRQ